MQSISQVRKRLRLISLSPAIILCSSAIKGHCTSYPRFSLSNSMKTITKQNTQLRQSKQSLIQDAFVVLLEHLGPEKTFQLWHLFFPPQEGTRSQGRICGF